MWWFVGLWYAFFFGLVGLYWGDLQPLQAPFVPWLIGGMMGSALIAAVLAGIANRMDARTWSRK